MTRRLADLQPGDLFRYPDPKTGRLAQFEVVEVRRLYKTQPRYRQVECLDERGQRRSIYANGAEEVEVRAGAVECARG